MILAIFLMAIPISMMLMPIFFMTLESREDRILKRALSWLRRAKPAPEGQGEAWSTQMRVRQRMEAAIRGVPREVLVKGVIENFKGLTPKEVDEELRLIKGEHTKHYKKEQEAKKQRDKEARKSLEFQKTPFYRICLGATYGIFGSFHGASGHSETGRKYAEELEKMDTQTLKDAIHRLKNRELSGYPLQGYPNDFIEQTIQYLTTEIITREGN